MFTWDSRGPDKRKECTGYGKPLNRMSALAAEGVKVVRLSSGDGRVEDGNNAMDWYKTIRLVTQDIGEVAIANVHRSRLT
jgi:hypothetical protein